MNNEVILIYVSVMQTVSTSTALTTNISMTGSVVNNLSKNVEIMQSVQPQVTLEIEEL